MNATFRRDSQAIISLLLVLLLTVKVVRVIDGDTIKICCIEWRLESVRYIGINTPETHHATKGVEAYGKEAAEANARLVSGKSIRLEFDVGRRDRHGRLLAYVYLEDGTFANAWLVEHGYARVMTVPPNVRYKDLFLHLERGARETGQGLWR
ncbi:MAG: thermonuclease family protein [candidate division NC10 bacterium]|nr:thermonuclease family protein [candidate division NC10 bacterium]